MRAARFQDDDLIGRADPVDGMPLLSGETVVVCVSCQRGYRQDSWDWQSNRSGRCLCGHAGGMRRTTLGAAGAHVQWSEQPVRRPEVSTGTPRPTAVPSATPPPSVRRTKWPLAGLVLTALMIAVFLIFNAIDGRRSTSDTRSHPTAYVTSVELNVRQGPGIDYPIIGRVSQGHALTIRGKRTVSSTGSVWVSVDAGSVEGWVNEKYLQDHWP
jgi:hypothetical protein